MKNAEKLIEIRRSKTCRSLTRLLCLLFFIAGVSGTAYANPDDIRVTGTVKDVSGEPLIGVSVVVKGTSAGAITNFDGQFNISVPDSKSVLVITYVGYTKQEIVVGNQTVFNITLSEDAELLEEVVVIGFQSQKKGNLTAAVSSVTSEMLENRPVANISQALQGVVPGLNIKIDGGDPTKKPEWNIRGETTFRRRGTSADDKLKFDVVSGAPLILMDGVEISAEDLNQLNPNDIENMSFLKDASAAAIYGTRATFGVVIVTTKSGKFNEKAKINYSYELALDQPYALPDILDSYHIYKALRDKDMWTGTISEYSPKDKSIMEAMQAYINDPKNNKNYIMDGDAIQWVGNTNPYKELVKDWTPTHKHNFSISGGGDRISYYMSLGVQDQSGMYEIRTDKVKRYNMMLSVNAKVTSWFNVSAKASHNIYDTDVPTLREEGANLWMYAKSYYPEDYIYKPVLTASDDPLPNMMTEHPVSYLYMGGKDVTSRRKSIFSISPEFIIIPNELKIKADISLTPTTYKREKTHPEQWRVNTSWKALENRWATQNTGYIARTTTDVYAINLYADYNKTIKDVHNISALIGVNQEKQSYEGSTLSLVDLLDPHILNPNLVEAVTANTSSNSHYVVTSRALFGRLMYNYKQRYLFEFDARYDGSSRFPSKDRFQLFPTVSAGWRVSEEPFMESTKDWLDNLKLRISWGRLGSQPSGQYPYQSVFRTESAYFLFNGNRYPTGVTTPSLTNPLLTWEKSTTKNVGFDLALLNSRLSVGLDVYERRVTEILIPGGKQYPALIGENDLPDENAGELKTTGFELSVKWADKLPNGLRYSVGASLFDSKAKVVSYPSNPTRTIGDGKLYSGQDVGEIWGYVTGGILQKEDFANLDNPQKPIYLGTVSKGQQVYPGYIWLKDLNNDGIISGGDGTVDNPGDRKVIGNSTPRYRYNLTLNAQWKGFDIDLMFQGLMKRDIWLSSASSYWGNGAGSWETYNQSWTPERTDAKFPMYHSGLGGTTQSGYLLDASYFKLKQVILGYTVPTQLVNKIGLQKIRLNLSAYNLFTISDVPKYYDSEYVSDAYPPKRTFSLGVQIGF